jgi:hypothetical protein
MTRDNFQRLFNGLAQRKPWRPFTIELMSGSRIEVNHPEAVSLGQQLVAVLSSSGHRSYFEYGSVARFIEATGVG